MRILVVEDNDLIATLICDALLDAGHEVLGPVTTASAGLELAQISLPDLALLNVDLADDVKGTHLARVLHTRLQIPILFVSGNINEVRKAQDVAFGYISKPCLPSTIVESIELVRLIVRGGMIEKARIPPGLTLFRGVGFHDAGRVDRG